MTKRVQSVRKWPSTDETATQAGFFGEEGGADEMTHSGADQITCLPAAREQNKDITLTKMTRESVWCELSGMGCVRKCYIFTDLMK